MIEKIACNVGLNTEAPNIEVACELCETKDAAGIKEIADGLYSKKKAEANDCIKVMYEIGTRKPELIAGYAGDFCKLLTSKNNRMVWGCMTVLATITDTAPDKIYENLNSIIKAYENGSVITIDNSMTVFAKLCLADEKYEKEIFPLLMKHLSECRPKEVAQHAERISICINSGNQNAFTDTIMKRYDQLTAAQAKRIDKLFKTLAKMQ